MNQVFISALTFFSCALYGMEETSSHSQKRSLEQSYHHETDDRPELSHTKHVKTEQNALDLQKNDDSHLTVKDSPQQQCMNEFWEKFLPKDNNFLSKLETAMLQESFKGLTNEDKAQILTHPPADFSLSDEDKAYCLAYAARFGDAGAFYMLSGTLLSYDDDWEDIGYTEPHGYLTPDQFDEKYQALEKLHQPNKKLIDAQNYNDLTDANWTKSYLSTCTDNEQCIEKRKKILDIINKK